jgi:hypothetical protein
MKISGGPHDGSLKGRFIPAENGTYFARRGDSLLPFGLSEQHLLNFVEELRTAFAYAG